jgi:hypothetical protein
MRQKFEAIRVTKETHEKAKFLSQKSNKTISATVTELIDAVFTCACTFSSLNLSYDFVISEAKVTVQCEGQNNLIVSETKMPKKVLRKEAKAPILEVTYKPKVKP